MYQLHLVLANYTRFLCEHAPDFPHRLVLLVGIGVGIHRKRQNRRSVTHNGLYDRRRDFQLVNHRRPELLYQSLQKADGENAAGI